MIISDKGFYNSFKLFEIKLENIIRYLLRKIHNHSSDGMRIISNNHEVHIEHILPKTIGDADAWNLPENDHEELLNRFGNLTLLGQEYSCRAINKGFKQKKEIYQQSDIPMTTSLTKYSNWTSKEIDARQEQLARIALKIWKKN